MRSVRARRWQGSVESMARIGLLALLLVGLGMAFLPAIAESDPPAGDPTATVTTKIEPGCVLAITVTGEKQLSQSYTVDPQGCVHFLLTDDSGGNKREWTVTVKDKMTSEARAAITESLTKYLKAPEVRVVIARMPRLQVQIAGGGAVKSGPCDLPLAAHLSDALSACGLLPHADLAHVHIEHASTADPKGATPPPQQVTVDFAAFQRGDSNMDPALEPGDKITIDKLSAPADHDLKYVSVHGEVVHEGVLPFSAGMTVKDAFDRVGGLKPTADPEQVHLVRGAEGKDYDLNADKVEANDPVQNLPLQPGDVLIVAKRSEIPRCAVLGLVAAPGAFELKPNEKMTVSLAVARAGGLKKEGDSHKATLIKGYLNNMIGSANVPVDLDKIARHQQIDFEMEPGDALIVPPKQHHPSFFQQLLPFLFRFLPFGL